MSADTKHPADVLSDSKRHERGSTWDLLADEQLRRIPALEAERDTYRARLDRAIAAAEEHFGEDAIRYKLSLFKNGRARNVFPESMDGRWVALQRADDDAHIGLSLRIVEAEAERDHLRAEVMEQARLLGMSGERELALRAEIDRLRKDADRLDWLADPANTIGNVQLPRECVEQNLHSLRDAIDAARKQQ